MARAAMGLAITLCITGLLMACQKSGPDEKSPYFIVLERSPSAAVAAKRAEQYQNQGKQFERAIALSLSKKGQGVLHRVTLCGFSSKGEARSRSKQLSGGLGNRLEVLDFRAYTLLDEEKSASATSPEGLEAIENMARLLPTPGQDRLHRFLITEDPKGLRGIPVPPGRLSPPRLSKGFGKLGFAGTAEAQYNTDGEGDGQVLWLAGRFEEPASPEQIKSAYNWLLKFVVEPISEEALEAEAKAKLKHKRKRKRKRKRRSKRRTKRRRKKVPIKKPKAPLVLKELPVHASRLMPWGKMKLWVVEHIHLGSKHRAIKEGGSMTAWMCLGPDGKRLWMMIFNDSDLLERLITVDSLAEPTGLTYDLRMASFWSKLPEAIAEGEELRSLGSQPLSHRYRKHRNQPWMNHQKENNDVHSVGYRNSKSGQAWQMTWVDLGDEARATQAFEQAWVNPRQVHIQTELRKKKVNYDMGVILKEIGDVQAWWLKGAARGRMQEIYFQRGVEVWLIQAPSSMPEEQLSLRLEVLPIWDSIPDAN
ncbi:MAG: hypothetical protein JRF33_01225 [Deltaproteobacteria bacterium]|nr:hypothetical protein [Deltaproteobacteria bacterium]